MKKVTALLFVLFSIGNSQAQQEDADTSAFSIFLDEFVVTGEYEPTHYKNAIHKVDIISKEQISQRGFVSLEQALSLNPNIRIYRDAILGSSISMRGIGSGNVSILIDGVPVIGRLDNAIDVSQISLQNVERIEIVEGALSNVYGNNAAGGVINIITKSSQINDLNVGVNSQIESVGIQQHEVSIGKKMGKFSVMANGRYFNYHQYPEDSLRLTENRLLNDSSSITLSKYPFNPKTQYGVNTTLKYKYSESGFLTLKKFYNQETTKDLGVVRRKQFNPYSDDEIYSTTRSDYQLRWNHIFGKLKLELISAYNQYDRLIEAKRYYHEDLVYDTSTISIDTNEFNSYFNKLVSNYKLNDNTKIVFGLSSQFENGKGGRLLDAKDSSFNVYYHDIAPFIEIQNTSIKDLKFSFSGRYNFNNLYKGKFTPGFHIKYDKNDWQFRASYSQGFRSPALKELYINFIDINHNIIGNTNLQPETSHDIQLSASYNSGIFKNIGFDVYRTIIKNQIDLVQYETLKYQYDNIDSYTVYGIQPSLQLSKKRFHLQSQLSIGFWGTQINEESTPAYGRVIDLNNQVDFDLTRLTKLSLNHRMLGNQPNYYLENNEVKLSVIEGYHLLDLSMSTKIWKNKINFVLGAKNLLDIQEITIRGGGSGGTHGAVGVNRINFGSTYFLSFNVQL